MLAAVGESHASICTAHSPAGVTPMAESPALKCTDISLSGANEAEGLQSGSRAAQRSRKLSKAGQSVFGCDLGKSPDESKAIIGRRPKLCWLLVGMFLVFTAVVCLAVTVLWRQTAAEQTKSVTSLQEHIRSNLEKVEEKAIDQLLQQLVMQDMNVEKLAVSEYLNMPFLAVSMLVGGMDQGLLSTETVDDNIRHLWWLHSNLPTLEREFAWGGIRKLENVFYADHQGLYASYRNICDDEQKCSLDGTKASHGFAFSPRRDLGNTTLEMCPKMCSSLTNTTSGHACEYSVDSVTGMPAALKSRRAYRPEGRPWWQRAVDAYPAAAWTNVYEFSSLSHPLNSAPSESLGLSVVRAHMDEAGKALMIGGASLTLRKVTMMLMGRVTLAARHRAPDNESCIFIVDARGRMIASSTGLEDVVCNRPNCTEKLLLWNETRSSLIKKTWSNFMKAFPAGFEECNASGMYPTEPEDYIYSHHRLNDGLTKINLDWIIMRAQPTAAYKEDIVSAQDTNRKQAGEQMAAQRSTNDAREDDALMLCSLFLASGATGLSFISWLVSRHLKKIASEMNKVARLDFESLDLESASSDKLSIRSYEVRNGDSIIHEVAKIGRSFENMKNGLRSFARYMDPYLVQVLVQSGQQARLGVAKAKVTVFFSDIANFTAMAEALEPAVLARLLGDYLEEMSCIIMRHDGIVGEFIGDEIMAWWNAPWDLGDRHAAMAIAAAVEQQQRLEELRQSWDEQGLPKVNARMGLVCGPVLAGNIGSKSRMKYGLVGDNVNLASRLEQLGKRYGVGILVDGKTCDEQGVRDDFFLRSLDVVRVKGRSEATELCEVVARKKPSLARFDEHRNFCERYAAIREMYVRGSFQHALDALAEFLSTWPDDRPAFLLKQRCQELLEFPPGPAWCAVEQLHEK